MYMRLFLDMGSDVDLIVQSQNMREHEKEDFLAEFEQERERPLAAFCVMGGVFSEGSISRKTGSSGRLWSGPACPRCVQTGRS